jgi:sulfatase modifying factor 1
MPGCSSVLGIDGLVADLDAGRAGDTPTGAEGQSAQCASACGTPGCGQCPTPTRIPVTSTTGAYAVDALEVTVAQYQAWLSTNPTTAMQRPECVWNDSYEPGQISPAAVQALAAQDASTNTTLCDEWASRGLDKPVTCVDWCDASAYCTWAKEHLCGRIGGGSIDLAQTGAFADAAQSEWFRACTGGGATTYPYGNTYAQGLCNNEGHLPVDVGSYTKCIGGYAGIFDMSANVAEWEDACTALGNPPVEENCLRRGGSWWSLSDAVTCAAYFVDMRGGLDNGLGFRCCAASM